MLATIKGTLFIGTTAFGSALLGTATDHVLDEKTPISAGVAVGVGVAVVSCAVWINRKFDKQDVSNKDSKRRFQLLERNVWKIQKHFGIEPVNMLEPISKDETSTT